MASAKDEGGVVNCGFASLRRSPERLQNGAGNASKWARRGQEPFGGSRRAFREAPRRFRGRKNIVRQVSGAEKSSPRGIFERCSRPEDEISAQKVPQEGPKKPSRGPPKCAKFRKAENAKFADSSMDFDVFVLPEGARTGSKWAPKRLKLAIPAQDGRTRPIKGSATHWKLGIPAQDGRTRPVKRPG